MSSLQRRIQGECSSTSAPAPSSSSVKATTFENCFSAGLDLSEFTPSSNVQTPSAAAELLNLKAREQKSEADLEQRISQVVHATKAKQTIPTYELSLRAENPHSSGRIGSDRDDNFLRFENGSSKTDNGFISSLVQSHNNEKKEFSSRSQKSMSKSKMARGNSTKIVGSRCTKQMGNKSFRVKNGSGKKLSAKKATKTKF